VGATAGIARSGQQSHRTPRPARPCA
jgi:hypothetical protein